jgi:hypothetical protein
VLFDVQVMDQKWYQTFTAEDNMPRELLFEVLTAANYMTIKPLLDLCCLKVTFQLTNKSAEEVSQTYEWMNVVMMFYLYLLSQRCPMFMNSFSLISCLFLFLFRFVKSSTFPTLLPRKKRRPVRSTDGFSRTVGTRYVSSVGK